MCQGHEEVTIKGISYCRSSTKLVRGALWKAPSLLLTFFMYSVTILAKTDYPIIQRRYALGFSVSTTAPPSPSSLMCAIYCYVHGHDPERLQMHWQMYFAGKKLFYDRNEKLFFKWGRGGGEWQYLTKTYMGRFRPKVQSLTFLYTIFIKNSI